MTARDTYASTISSNHATALNGAIAQTALQNAPSPGNLSGWSVAAVNAQFQNGTLTAAQAQRLLLSIASWESVQRDVARSVLQATGDTGPA